MTKHYILSFLAVMLQAPAFAQMDIASARQQSLGSTVTISGIVTNGAELGNIRYIQDATAGLPAFPGSGSVPGFAATVIRGDSISVTGILVDFNGLLEISPITNYTIHTSGNALPAPIDLDLQHTLEEYEGSVGRCASVTFKESGFFTANNLYTIVDPGGHEAVVYIRNGSPIAGTLIPSGAIDLLAIVSDFNGIQLLPRDTDDFIPVGELFFTQLLRQRELSTSSVTFDWMTNIPAEAIISTTYPDLTIRIDTIFADKDHHTFTLDDLQAGTFYQVSVNAIRPGINIAGNRIWMSTASGFDNPIDVYFTQSADPAYSMGPLPVTTSGDAIWDALLTWIATAESTIDVCIYNINEVPIVAALEQAWQKGVRVRLIAAAATSNTALDPLPSFPVIFGNTAGLMHNKFVIIDAGIPKQSCLWTGSMNFTTPQIYDHYNNMVMLRDPTIAKAYTWEFNEMWGSQDEFPDETQSRFGSKKKDNTPHLFRMGSTLVELYFSPSDRTNYYIDEKIKQATNNISFALLTFTKDDLAESFIANYKMGINVRGIIDNINDNGSEYALLIQNGVPVKDHTPSTILHHKYAIMDEAMVVTGSHNWSNAANSINDENTVIIHDAAVANVFRQEFEARWNELAPLSVSHPQEWTMRFSVWDVKDNLVWVRSETTQEESGYWQILNVLGHTIFSGKTTACPEGTAWHQLELPLLPDGPYILQWCNQHIPRAQMFIVR